MPTVAITLEILRQWLQGKSRMPDTWLTLIKCLRDTGLNVLADDIKSALSHVSSVVFGLHTCTYELNNFPLPNLPLLILQTHLY